MCVGAPDEADLIRIDADALRLAQPLDERVARVVEPRHAAAAALRTHARSLLAVCERLARHVADLLEVAELVGPAGHAIHAVAALELALLLHDLDDRLEPRAQARLLALLLDATRRKKKRSFRGPITGELTSPTPTPRERHIRREARGGGAPRRDSDGWCSGSNTLPGNPSRSRLVTSRLRHSPPADTRAPPPWRSQPAPVEALALHLARGDDARPNDAARLAGPALLAELAPRDGRHREVQVDPARDDVGDPPAWASWFAPTTR